MSEAFGGGNIARFATAPTTDHPATAMRRASLAVLDTIGTMTAGAQTSAARAARAAASLDGGQASPVFGSGQRAGVMAAAMANGVAASALDLDDGHTLGGSIHPGAAIVPALLSVADPDTQLVELVASVLVAYEVAIRAGYLLWPEDRSHQAHMAGTPAAIGGAVGAARQRGLDTAEARRALEIAAAHTPVAALQFPHVKESLGWAAATAAGAALLADAGFKDGAAGGEEAFAYRAHPPTAFDRDTAADAFVSSIGSVYEIENTYFKPYGACRFVHTAADALRDLQSEHGFRAADIEAIAVGTHREAVYLNSQGPTSIEEGQYSFPFALAALAIADGDFPLTITESTLADSAVHDLARRIIVGHEPELDRHYPEDYPSRVRVRTNDGRDLEQTEIVAWGAPAKPMDEDSLRRKFLALTEPSLGSQADEIWGLFEYPKAVAVGEVVERLQLG